VKEATVKENRNSIPVGFWILSMAEVINMTHMSKHVFVEKGFSEVCSDIERMEIGPIEDEMMILAGLSEALFVIETFTGDVPYITLSAIRSAITPRAKKILEKLEAGDTSLSKDDRRLALAWLHSVIYDQPIPDWFVKQMWIYTSKPLIEDCNDWWRMILSVQLAGLLEPSQAARVLNDIPDENKALIGENRKNRGNLCLSWFDLSDRTMDELFKRESENNRDPEYLTKYGYLQFLKMFLFDYVRILQPRRMLSGPNGIYLSDLLAPREYKKPVLINDPPEKK
jgi:hypothetical protein